MCSTGPFQHRWLKGYIYSSCYYHHQIGSIHLSHCYHILSEVVCLRCLLHHILLLIAYTFRENRKFVFINIGQFMMSANSRIRFGWEIIFVYLYITPSHYHHCANLSEDIELIKFLSDIFCRVCEKDRAHSLSYPSYNMWGCVFSVYPIPLFEKRYTFCLIIIKSEVWGLDHETMVCVVCLSIYLLVQIMACRLFDINVLQTFLNAFPSV